MAVHRRGIASVVIVALAAAVISIGAVVVRLVSPSSGTVIAATGRSFTAGGVSLEVLPGATTMLRDGDLVTAMHGRLTATWADTWLPAEDDAQPLVGDRVRFDVERGAGSLAVDVPLAPYPAWEVIRRAIGTVLFVVAMAVIGLFVFVLRPTVPAAGALLLAGVGAAGSTFPYLLGTDPLDLTTGAYASGMAATGFVYLLLWGGLVDFALVFPRPIDAIARRPVLRMVPYASMLVGFGTAVGAAALVTPTTLEWLGAWGPLTLLPAISAFIVAPVIMLSRWRRGSREDRVVLRGFAIVTLFIVVANAVVWVIPESLGGRPLLPWSISPVLGLPFPAMVATSIVRHRAFDINVVVRRSVVYGGLTLAIFATYAVSAAILGAVLGSSSGFATSLLATGVAAVVALPVRDLLQRGAARILYGDRDEPVRAIRRLGERLALVADPETMPRVVVDTVADALRLPYVALELGTGPAARLAAARGAPPHETTVRPLAHGGRTSGRLLVGARGRGDPLTASDLRLLDDLCRQVGVALDAARLTDDLRASRERIVTGREEERRRLRRDLHDGLGPTLAAIGMRAEATRDLLARDPTTAAQVLAELQAEASAAVTEVRRLVDGLRPPAIDEVGLIDALRLAADRLRAPGGPEVSVEADATLPPLPAAVEVAAYRIATEAVTNAVRHASAATCRVVLTSGRELSVTVEDDGRGLPATPREGVGLASMRERAAELGGELRVGARPGEGTRIVARLPLPVSSDGDSG